MPGICSPKVSLDELTTFLRLSLPSCYAAH
jgi:hypothetical protein